MLLPFPAGRYDPLALPLSAFAPRSPTAGCCWCLLACSGWCARVQPWRRSRWWGPHRRRRGRCDRGGRRQHQRRSGCGSGVAGVRRPVVAERERRGCQRHEAARAADSAHRSAAHRGGCASRDHAHRRRGGPRPRHRQRRRHPRRHRALPPAHRPLSDRHPVAGPRLPWASSASSGTATSPAAARRAGLLEPRRRPAAAVARGPSAADAETLRRRRCRSRDGRCSCSIDTTAGRPERPAGATERQSARRRTATITSRAVRRSDPRCRCRPPDGHGCHQCRGYR